MQTINIGFLGFGNIGMGVYKILKGKEDEIFKREGIRIKVKKILVRDLNKERNIKIATGILTDKAEEVIKDPDISLYILTKMSEEGKDFESVLNEAKDLGYAEPDPTSDIEGYDPMFKLSILSTLAFHTGVPVEEIFREGITSITIDDIEYGKELGYAIRLLAIAKRQGKSIQVRVHPTFIPLTHPLAAVRDSYNGIFIKGDAVGNLMLYGRGAGALPTGSAIVSDIINACLNKDKHIYSTLCSANNHISCEKISFNKNWEAGYFIRITVKDKPGVLANIAGIFGKHLVSIASVIQKGRNGGKTPIIFVTHKAKELSIRKAVRDMQNEPSIIKVDSVIRVED